MSKYSIIALLVLTCCSQLAAQQENYDDILDEVYYYLVQNISGFHEGDSFQRNPIIKDAREKDFNNDGHNDILFQLADENDLYLQNLCFLDVRNVDDMEKLHILAEGELISFKEIDIDADGTDELFIEAGAGGQGSFVYHNKVIDFGLDSYTTVYFQEEISAQNEGEYDSFSFEFKDTNGDGRIEIIKNIKTYYIDNDFKSYDRGSRTVTYELKDGKYEEK